MLTDDVDELVSRDDVDIVVEVMGPVEPARKAILAALEGGKSVVTANKALMAQSTGELAQAAEQAHVDLYFEAAVAGAIPVIRPLTQSLAGDTVLRVAGIVNGTTNYILSAMNDTGASYDERTGRCQRPRLRRGRPDRRRRGLRRRRQGGDPGVHRVPHPGDRRRRVPRGHHQGHRRGLRVREGAWAAPSSCCRSASGSPPTTGRNAFRPVSTRHWCRCRTRWPTVNGAFNAVVVEAAAAGRLMFYGQGAGGAPTASAVMGDLVMAARNRVQGGRGPRESKYAQLPIAPIGVIPTRYYVSLYVDDRPGVLSSVAAEFAKREVSIAEVRQEGMVDEGGQRVGARIAVSPIGPPTPRCARPLPPWRTWTPCGGQQRAANGRSRRMSAPRHAPCTSRGRD